VKPKGAIEAGESLFCLISDAFDTFGSLWGEEGTDVGSHLADREPSVRVNCIEPFPPFSSLADNKGEGMGALLSLLHRGGDFPSFPPSA